jgi:two-component system, NarL family, response regulator NreC
MAAHAPPKILVLTMHKDKEYVFEAMAAGASGYLLKDEADAQLFAAIDRIRLGAVYVSPHLVGESTHDWTATHRPDQAAREPEPLTVREREVLKLTAEGNTSKQIAEALDISRRTVEHHRASIAVKLNMKGTADLVRYAIAKGYVSLTGPCPRCATPRRTPATASEACHRGPGA